jgi:hypothetical protein
MKQRLSKEQADAAADALLSQEPRFDNSWIGRLLKRFGERPVPSTTWQRDAIRKMPEPTGFESPGSAQWDVVHRQAPFE